VLVEPSQEFFLCAVAELCLRVFKESSQLWAPYPLWQMESRLVEVIVQLVVDHFVSGTCWADAVALSGCAEALQALG
jgi:hypothetical protein